MKTVSYRISLLVTCATFALSAADAYAFGSDNTPPSIEIHLDVLSALSHARQAAAPAQSETGEKNKQAMTGAKKPSVTPSLAADDDQPTPLPKKKLAAKHDAAAHKMASKEPAKPLETIPAPEMKMTGAEMPAGPVPPAPAPASQAATAAPEAVAGAIATPRLSASDMPPPAEPSPPAPATADSAATGSKAVLSGISTGFSDVLSGDGDKAAPAKPAAAEASPGVKRDAVGSSAGLPAAQGAPDAAAAALPLNTPPAELSSAAPEPSSPGRSADRNMPVAALPLASPSAGSAPAISDAPSSLNPAIESGKEADKTALLPGGDAPPTPPRLDLPAPSAPMQMAQDTLTPLSVPPSSPQAAPSPTPTPAAAPAAPLPPAPAAAAAPEPTPPLAAEIPSPPRAAPIPSGTSASLRLAFNENETDIPLGSTGQLDAVAKTLSENPSARVNIVAYASGPETTGIYPKRVSLARGIAVRNYLTTNKGIDIERVNVKAMGNKNEAGGPGDRVDVFILK